MNPVAGCFLAVVMAIMFLYGCVDQAVLSWGNPDATHRRLWIDYTCRMIFDTFCIGIPMLAILIFYPDEKNK